MSDVVTVAAPPSTNDATQAALAIMGALSGVLTDYNKGSQIRTFEESNASIIDMQGVASTALALQALAYGALTAFGITPNGATVATGTLTFTTGPSGTTLPPAVTNITIPQGTLSQTSGGIQVQTTAAAVILAGQTTVTGVPSAATTGGSAGNIPIGAVGPQPQTPLGQPIYVTNPGAFSGGAPAETLSQTMARFAAATASLGLASPQAVADAAIGVNDPVSGTTCMHSRCWEPWAAAAPGTTAAMTAGFTLYIDDGSGTAGSGLISAVNNVITGGVAQATVGVQDPGVDGYRPAGVPYSVQSAVPTGVTVAVTGVLMPSVTGTDATNTTTSIQTAMTAFFADTQIGGTVGQGDLAATAGNAALGNLSSLTVVLNGGAQSVTGPFNGRVILTSLSVVLTPSTS